MFDPLSLTHLLLVLNLVTLVVTLTLSGGRVTGLPFMYERPSSGSSRTSLERMANSISIRLEHLTAQQQTQGAQITDLGTRLAKVTQSVSFTVTFSGRDIGDLRKDEALKFDRVLFNAGDGYNQKTGLFTAPQEGLYAFSLQVNRHPRDPTRCVEVDLVHSSTQQSPHPALSQQQPHPASPTEQHQLPSDISKQQQQQESLSTLSNNHHDYQQQQQQQPSSSALLFKQQQQIMSTLLCLHDNNSTTSRAVVRLAHGDSVQARMRSGTMLLGEVFTSMSGLKLPALSSLFRPLLH